MKLCRHCNQTKSLENFYYDKSKKTYRYICKACDNNRIMRIQQTLKQKYINYLGGECNKCGYNQCIAALDFHHKNPKEKDFNISKYKSSDNWDKIKPELDKCILLCANCHRELHYTSC